MNKCDADESVTNDVGDDLNINVVKNRVYFYEDINEKTILKLTSTLDKLSAFLINMKNEYSLKNVPKIYLHIQSYGGDVFSGLSGMNSIENSKVPVVTVVDGLCCASYTVNEPPSSVKVIELATNLSLTILELPSIGNKCPDA